MRSKELGITTWGAFSILVFLFGVMVFGMLYGTGVFKNWGKRTLSEEADRALYVATGRLLVGDTADVAATFPEHIAGKSAREIYQLLRSDMIDAPAIDAEYRRLEGLSKAISATGLKDASQAFATLKRLYEGRQDRAARLVLRLKAWAPESDRLTRQYRKIAQAFQGQEGLTRDPRDKRAPPDESDNLFGGPNRILELRIEFGEAVVSLYNLLAKNPSDFALEGSKVVLKDGKSDFAASYRSSMAKLERLENLSKFYVRRLATAVEAERRGLKRSLGL